MQVLHKLWREIRIEVRPTCQPRQELYYFLCCSRGRSGYGRRHPARRLQASPTWLRTCNVAPIQVKGLGWKSFGIRHRDAVGACALLHPARAAQSPGSSTAQHCMFCITQQEASVVQCARGCGGAPAAFSSGWAEVCCSSSHHDCCSCASSAVTAADRSWHGSNTGRIS